MEKEKPEYSNILSWKDTGKTHEFIIENAVVFRTTVLKTFNYFLNFIIESINNTSKFKCRIIILEQNKEKVNREIDLTFENFTKRKIFTNCQPEKQIKVVIKDITFETAEKPITTIVQSDITLDEPETSNKPSSSSHHSSNKPSSSSNQSSYKPSISSNQTFYKPSSSSNQSSNKPSSSSNQSSNKPSSSSNHICKLKNLGQTCYFNSLMQALFCIKQLRDKIISYNGGCNLLNELKKLFTAMNANEEVKPEKAIFDILKLNIKEQKDLREVMFKIIDVIKSDKEFWYVEYFQIKIKNTIIENSNERQATQDDYSLRLNVEQNSDIQTLINNYFQEETIQDANIKIKNTISGFPKIFAIQTVRQNQDFSITINENITIQEHDYKLKAVIIFAGVDDFGHYKAVVRPDSKWFKTSDDAPLVDVDDPDKDTECKKSSYALFYELDK